LTILNKELTEKPEPLTSGFMLKVKNGLIDHPGARNYPSGSKSSHRNTLLLRKIKRPLERLTGKTPSISFQNPLLSHRPDQ